MAPTKKKKTAKKAAVKKPAKKSAAKTVIKAVKKIASKMAVKSSVKDSVATPGAFKPLDDRLIIRVQAADEKTAGGIIIPGSAAEKPNLGTVLAAGPGRRNKKGVLRPLDVRVGDKVIFPQYAGQKIEIESEEFLILREDEVLAISLA